jgi:hypothetical protein
MNGIFAAQDGVLFYIFFEAMLIPMYLIIGIWGGPNRVYAAFKFFLYTLLGSVLMLVALIWLFRRRAAASHPDWHQMPLDLAPQQPDLHRLPAVLRGQGPDVAGAYLVARCPRRSAHRRLGGAGGHRAEARRLRLPAFSLPIAPDASITTWRS